MGRNVAIQHLRGIFANIPALDDGEFYLATDTGRLYVGLDGINFSVGGPIVANLSIQGNAFPTHFIEPNADGSINVSGIIFPAIQPVSGIITANAGTGTFVVDDLASSGIGSAVPANAMYIGGNKSGNLVGLLLDANGNLSVNISDVGGNAATAKGVQPAAAIPTQDLKDSGRVIKTFSAAFTAATTEALITLTPNSDGTLGATGTSFSVTAGKRFRLQAIMLTCFNATAAIHACQVNVRMSTTGAVTTASPIISTVAVSTAAATANLSASQAQSLPDGVELSGTMQFGISQIGVALAGQTVVLVGYEY